MKVLGLIPARGGSKGVPRKNLKLLGGKPLIAWTIEASLRATAIDRVIVSTDDEEIADTAYRLGAEIPFLRPGNLALDNTPAIDVALHALEQLAGHDALLLLQPTSPFRTAQSIDEIVRLAINKKASSVVSVAEATSHPYWAFGLRNSGALSPFFKEGIGSIRRQDLPRAVCLNGALYFSKVSWLIEQKRFIGDDTLGFLMQEIESIDLDTERDFQFAEFLLSSYK